MLRKGAAGMINIGIFTVNFIQIFNDLKQIYSALDLSSYWSKIEKS